MESAAVRTNKDVLDNGNSSCYLQHALWCQSRLGWLAGFISSTHCYMGVCPWQPSFLSSLPAWPVSAAHSSISECCQPARSWGIRGEAKGQEIS